MAFVHTHISKITHESALSEHSHKIHANIENIRNILSPIPPVLSEVYFTRTSEDLAFDAIKEQQNHWDIFLDFAQKFDF